MFERSLLGTMLIRSTADNSYDWPRKDDVTDLKKAFIFCGPLNLQGNGPFTISDIGTVKKMYTQLKKHKDILLPNDDESSSE